MSDFPGPARRDRALTFPIRLCCANVNDLLISTGLEDAVARALGRAFGHARRALPADDVLGGGVVLRPPELVSGTLPPREEAALLGLLARAIGRAAQSQALPLGPAAGAGPPSAAPAHAQAQARSAARTVHPRPAKPRKKPAGASPWHVRIEVGFHITPRKFFEIRKKLPPRRQPGQEDPADLLELYYPLLDKPMRATAWIVEVSREHELLALDDEVTRRFAVTQGPGEYIWAIHGWGRLLALVAEADRDHKVAGRIPEFTARGFTENRPGPARGEQQTFLRPGAWVFSVFLPLPNMALGDLVEVKPLPDVDALLSESGALFTPEAFTAEVGIDWATAVRAAPDYQIRVAATAFTVRRKVHERTLAALSGRYRYDTFGTRLGCVVPFTESALHELGPTIEASLGPLVGPGSPGQQGPVDGFWLPGAAAVNLTPRLPKDFGRRLLRQANAAFTSGQADEAQRILQLENSLLGADRDLALARFIIHWQNVKTSALFPFLLDELRERGAIDAFLNAVRDLPSRNTDLKRTVVALAAGSSWAEDSRMLALAHDIEALVHSLEKFHYDVEKQEIWIDGDPRFAFHAANGSGDDQVGVVGVVKPFYSESGRIPQPKPEILERLREPTRKKVAELVGRMVCGSGEQLTQEELLQKAMNEAAKEMAPLEEKDLVKVTLLKSVRVLKLESSHEGGVQKICVHYQPVQKVGDNPWTPAGDVIVQPPVGFEAYLKYYEVEHLEAALTVFALAETVILGGVLIIELGIASALELFFFVSMQVVMYHLTTDPEERSLEGYLTAVLKGELDAVGFKFLSVGVKSLGGFVAGELVTSKLVSTVGTKWIVFLLRGTAMAAGVGGLEVTYLFADDLLHYSHCRGWSSPGQYWDRFKSGFVMTLAFEFVAVPILTPAARLALEKARSAVEAARALRSSGKSLLEITEALTKGADKAEAAIGDAISHDAGPAIARGFRDTVADVLTALRREYQTRAYGALLELYGSELSGDAAKGLRRLLGTAGESQVDALLQRLLEEKAAPEGLLGALGKADEGLVADLTKAGKLAEAGVSQRVLTLLTRDPELGARLLRAPFRFEPAGLERFLEDLEPLPADAGESVLRALARDTPLPPDILLGAARQVGALDEPTLALLRRLHDAGVRMDAFFDGSGPSLGEFAGDFARLPEAQQAAALENAAGRTPAQVLEQAEAQPAPAGARPAAPAAGTLDEIARELEGKGFSRADLRKFMGKRERLSAELAGRVARLLDHFAPEEVREFGEFLARHKVYLNENTVAQLIENVPRGELEATIGELEEIRAGGEPSDAELSEEELAEQAGVTISHHEPPPVRGGPLPYAGLPVQEPPAGALEGPHAEHVEVPPGGPIEAPLPDVVETHGSRALRASLIARDGVEPPPGSHAHHIVPENEFAPGLDWARDRLVNAGSGINEAGNGVFLAGSRATPNPELTRLHNSYIHAGPSKEYAYTLTSRLADKTGEEFLTEVEKIGKEMEEGEFKTLEIPYGWKTKWEPGMTAPVEPGVEPEWIDE